jgi:hypothetical protein
MDHARLRLVWQPEGPQQASAMGVADLSGDFSVFQVMPHLGTSATV